MPVSHVARAQVTTDSGALDSLGTQSHAASHAAHRGGTHHPHRASPAASHPATQRPGSVHASAPAATIAAAPPPPPVLAPPGVQVPLHPPPPPPPVPVVEKAVGKDSPLPAGTRITFGANSADLNHDTMDALIRDATILKDQPARRADIYAYAPPVGNDESSARRLSLSRGLAARAVLIHVGLPSTRIYVRALGSGHVAGQDAALADGPPDRLDLVFSDPADAAAGSQTPPAGTHAETSNETTASKAHATKANSQ